MIRGKRNFLPHTPLVMAFAILFRVDDSCAARHAGERKSKFRDTEATIGDANAAADGSVDGATSNEVAMSVSTSTAAGTAGKQQQKRTKKGDPDHLKPAAAPNSTPAAGGASSSVAAPSIQHESSDESDVDITGQFLRYANVHSSTCVAASTSYMTSGWYG